jgi:integrase
MQHTEEKALALYGTNGLTDEYLKSLDNLPELEKIVLFLDGDAAGEAAVIKWAEVLHNRYPKLTISQVATPEGEDVNGLVSRAKNHHQRYVPLSAGVQKDLADWLGGGRHRFAYPNCDNVLLNRRGGPANNSGLNKQLAEICELAGVEKVSLHGLRHSIATHLLADGMGLAAIGRFLGHRSLQATQTYTHLVDEL